MATRSQSPSALAAARAALAQPLTYEAYLSKLGAKDRLQEERHAATLEAGPFAAVAALWRRLTCAMSTLAPHAVKLYRQQSAQFFVADGKYKMQVFALDDTGEGALSIYCADVLSEAGEAGLLAPAEPDPHNPLPNMYRVQGGRKALTIERLDSHTPSPAPFFKDMMGWNRKALRITLPLHADDAQLSAVELLCALSMSKWNAAPAPT